MTDRLRGAVRLPLALLALALLASPAQAQKRHQINQPLNVQGIAGQQVPVLPLTLVVADSAVMAQEAWAPWQDRLTALGRADSILGEYLQSQAPEVVWLLPPDLRRAARRGGGMVPEPDRLGHAVLRAPNMEKVPGPMAAGLRSLVSLSGGRVALAPAALGFGPDSTGAVKTRLAVVAIDVRRGAIIWRTYAEGTGATPDAAFVTALRTIIPPPPTDVIAP